MVNGIELGSEREQVIHPDIVADMIFLVDKVVQDHRFLILNQNVSHVMLKRP